MSPCDQQSLEATATDTDTSEVNEVSEGGVRGRERWCTCEVKSCASINISHFQASAALHKHASCCCVACRSCQV